MFDKTTTASLSFVEVSARLRVAVMWGAHRYSKNKQQGGVRPVIMLILDLNRSGAV